MTYFQLHFESLILWHNCHINLITLCIQIDQSVWNRWDDYQMLVFISITALNFMVPYKLLRKTPKLAS